MGATEKANLKMCGEILINMKTKNKKNKIYTFNCAFCNANCDQLKKFSIHLKENHFEQFSEETVIYVPEIKEEDLGDIVTKDDVQKHLCISIHEDPLEAIETVETDLECSDIKAQEIKKKYNMEFKDYNMNEDEIDRNDCIEDIEYDYSDYNRSESECNEKFSVQLSKLRQRKKIKLSDDDSNEILFKSKRKDEHTKKSLKNIEPGTESKISEKQLGIALLKAFEKQTILWKVKERTKYNKVSQKYFEIISKEVNKKLTLNLTWDEAKLHIRKMRNHYSDEMQKKNLGLEYELPWYTEHMKFLQENIQVLLKGRQGVKKYKPLKTMDESQLSILIDIYRKYDSLWQVNNIAFGARRKRDEVFEKIVQEHKLNHNLCITVDDLHRRVNYMLRVYSENKQEHLKCELANRKFKPSSSLYDKMYFLNDCQGPFKCLQCNEIIKRFDNYHIHVAKHNDTIPFPCPLCKKAFHKYNNYIIHARRHMELNNHFCKFCDRGYPTTTELAIHERSHTGENPYLCQICGATFKAPHSYDSHIRRHENRFRYVCHICNHGFNHSHELNDHVKAHLNIRDIVCNVCGKSFTATKFLKYHQLIHAAEKRYKCKVCGKAFAQTAGLRQHRKQHQPFSTLYKKLPSNNFDTVLKTVT